MRRTSFQFLVTANIVAEEFRALPPAVALIAEELCVLPPAATLVPEELCVPPPVAPGTQMVPDNLDLQKPKYLLWAICI